MTSENFNSPLLDRAVAELSKLPGIGHKTALRLALHILRRDPAEAEALGNSILELRRGIRYCSVCHNISENDVCEICANPRRDLSTVCVVESVKDVISVEATGEYRGGYHVLGGLISPIEGVAPSDLEIDSLVQRVHSGSVREVILALSPTIEGDTTNFYIYRRLADTDAAITILARGISIGSDLEYTDELTLGSSLLNRIPFSQTFSK